MNFNLLRKTLIVNFAKTFVERRAMGEKCEAIIKPNRKCGRQTTRHNYERAPENYF